MRLFLTLFLTTAFWAGQYIFAIAQASNADEQNPANKLIDAARAGQFEIVREFLTTGVSPNAKHSETGLSALMEAAGQGHLDIVNLLLKSGADVNDKVVWQQTGARAAAMKYWYAGRAESSVDAKSKTLRVYGSGWSALMSASRGGHVEIIKLLIQNRARLNESVYNNDAWYKDHFFNDILPNARHKKAFTLSSTRVRFSEEIVRPPYRASLSADISNPKPVLNDLFSLEPIQPITKKLQYVPDNVFVDTIDCLTALMAASEQGHIEAMKVLIDAGANVHTKCPFGNAISLAVYEEDPKAVSLLLQEGADVNSKDNLGYSLLSIAIDEDNVEIAKLLLQAGANPNAKYALNEPFFSDRTILTRAVEGEKTAIVKLLLDFKVNLNEQDKSGDTALIMAVSNSSIEIIKLLLAAGAEVKIENRAGESALSLATEPEIVRLLRTYVSGQRKIKK